MPMDLDSESLCCVVEGDSKTYKIHLHLSHAAGTGGCRSMRKRVTDRSSLTVQCCPSPKMAASPSIMLHSAKACSSRLNPHGLFQPFLKLTACTREKDGGRERCANSSDSSMTKSDPSRLVPMPLMRELPGVGKEIELPANAINIIFSIVEERKRINLRE